MPGQGFVTHSEYQKHIRGEWRTIHNLWPHIRKYVPGWGYSKAEIDAMFAGTQGSIAFADASGFIAEDNANLFWDEANARLGLNQITPTARIDIVAEGSFPGINISAGAFGEMSTPEGGEFRWGHWNELDTFTLRLKFDAAGIFFVSYLTAGSVIFAGANGEIKQDNANLRWNDTLDVLEVGPADNCYVGKGVVGTGTSTGGTNVYIGNEAGEDNTDGYGNVFIGYRAGTQNRGGDECVFVGSDAGLNNSSGNKNVSIGRTSSLFNRTGSENVVMGYKAGYSTAGQNFSQSVLIGSEAGLLIRSTGNICIGYRAGDNITTGDSNVIIGHDLDAPSAVAHNQIKIGNAVNSLTVESTSVVNQDLTTDASPTLDDLTLSNPVNIYALSHDSFADYVADEHMPALDEDDMGSDSDTNVATQQSVKAYVDAQIAGVNEFTELTDTPANYVGSGGKSVKVKAALDGLEFADLVKADITDTPWAWGDVDKTGSNLTDLATRQHAGLTDVTSDQHHAQLHAASHADGQPDVLSHDALADYVANQHRVWEDSIGQDVHADNISEGSVTQHVGAIDHDALLNTHANPYKLDDLAAPDDNTDLDFSTTKHGLVPKGTNVGDFLKDDGTWAAAGGGAGDVTAAAVLVDHTIIRGDGGAKGVQDSGVVIDDADNVTGIVTLTLPNEGLHILDTNASHDLIIKAGSDLTADRILTIYTGDAAKEITLTGNPTLDNWFDQSVKVGASPTLAGLEITDIFIENHGADHNLFLGHLAGSSIAGGGQYNLFIGEDSGLDITVGDRNILIGYETGKEANTTAYDNICIGYQAGLGVDGNIYSRNVFIGTGSGKAVTTAHRNTAVGHYSLTAITGGYYNVAIGWYAGYSLLGGHSNTFLGQSAGYNTTTGYSNVAVGNDALHGVAASTAFRNVAIGDHAGYDTITGASLNVFVGFSAGYFNESGTQNTFIGAYAGQGVDGEVNSLNTFIGRGAAVGITTGSNNVVIGALTAPVLTSGSNNVFIGYHAGHTLTTQGNNTFVGAFAGESITGTGNTAYGHYSLRAGGGAGGYNTAIGVQCLTSASGQSFNTAVGFGAGLAQNTGHSNVYMGYHAGYADDSTGNVAIGRVAGYNMKAGSNYNISIGYSACQGNIANTHTHNVCIGGYRTGYILDAGNYNIMIGSYCGDAITSGSNNVLIGYNAGSSLTTHAGNVMIGYAAGQNATASNTLYIANTNTVTPLIYGEFDTPLLKVTGEFDVVGPSKLGDGGTTNYAETKADGEINLHGTARVIKQIYLNNAAFTKGSTAPTQVILGNLNAWEFDIGDDAVMTAMLLPDWAAGTLITIKVCWYIDEAYAADKEIQWRVDWSALPHDFSEAVDAPTHSGQIDSGDIDIPAVAKRMGISTIGTIAGANLSAGDMLGFTLSRIAVTHDDPTADPAIHHLIIEYTADKLGTAT